MYPWVSADDTHSGYLTADEAKALALREGLQLATSHSNMTGYHRVVFDPRKKDSKKKYSVYSREDGAGVGCFATAEEAALAYARRTGNTAASLPGRGCSVSSRAALAHTSSVILSCLQCSALVQYAFAKHRAVAAGRDEFEPSDGCASRVCSGNHGPGSFAKGQHSMAAALAQDTRALYHWPSSVHCEIKELREMSAEEADTAIRAAMAAAAAVAKHKTAARGTSQPIAATPSVGIRVSKRARKQVCCADSEDEEGESL